MGPRGWPGHFFDDFVTILVSFWGRFLTSFWKILAQCEVAVHKVIAKWCSGKLFVDFYPVLVSILDRFCDFFGLVDIVKTVLPLARESYFRGFDV